MNVPKQTNKQKGFTIIEVVLVLAIAGLIFLMVFIALPALQRNQRDTQRRNDLSRVQTAIQNYQTNNRNGLPSADDLKTGTGGLRAKFITNYLTAGGDTFTDPDGTDYKFVTGNAVADSFTAGEITYTKGKTCEGENLKDAGSGKIAFQYKLEGGGTACVSN
jgi:prepilin-type N-terminal cleavage/methylation domain-containing protein